MKKWVFYFAWTLSLMGLLLSLYYGEILGMEPCRLCWYQRCALFPLAFLLGIAVYRDDRNFVRYGLILAAAGLFLAFIQIFAPASLCSQGCTEKTAVISVLTLPMISAIGFAGIFGLLLWTALEKKN